MSIELPKDAEGREIPLDVEFLYNAIGEPVKPYSFTFRRYDGFGWDMHLVGVQNSVYDPKSFYLTPPDSWEKLEDDLQRIGIGGSGWFCMYAGYCKNDDSCHSECKFYEEKTPCARQAARDIVSRIRKLRGEDE